MGDRVNVVIKSEQADPPSYVYLYSHWGGYDMPLVVQKALAKKWRWDDGAYLARIIFDQMTEGSVGGETGFGIDTRPCDNEHPYIVVDPATRRVGFTHYDWRQSHLCDPENVREWWSFDEYIQLSEGALGELWRSRGDED